LNIVAKLGAHDGEEDDGRRLPTTKFVNA